MQHNNTFLGGMKRGIDNTLMPQNSYTYMLNGSIVSKDDHGFTITNIRGTKNIASFGTNEVPIGCVSFNGIIYIVTHDFDNEKINFYSFKGSNGTIWVEETLLIIPNGPNDRLSINQSVLGFTKGKLLEMIAKNSYDGSVDLYICDGLNKNIIINTGIDQDGKKTLRSYTNLDDIVLFVHQKSITKVPDVQGQVKDNGSIKPGTYFFYIRYEDESLNTTPFIKEVGPFYIHSGSKEFNSSSGVLNTGEQRVSKQVQLQITNTDSNYKKVSVGFVHYYGTSDTLSKSMQLITKSTKIINGSVNIIFNGNNGVQDITFEELFKDNMAFDIAETEVQHEDRYYGANWKGRAIDYNMLKEMASLIIPHAVIKNENNIDKVYDQDSKDFEYMEDEIYPMGVSFLIDGQYKTPVFPVCGWYEGVTLTNANGTIPDMNYTDFRTYIDNRHQYFNESPADTLKTIDNYNGLYKFPRKGVISHSTNADDLKQLHFKLMGVEFIRDFAYEYYQTNKALLPNITTIYFVQGNRQENVVCQGYSCAMVEAVGFKNTFECYRGVSPTTAGDREVSQSTKLGTHNIDVAFPFLGGDRKLFPVIKIERYSQGWSITKWGVTELQVMNKEEILVREQETDASQKWTYYNNPTANDMWARYYDHRDYFLGLKTNKYSVFTPDLLLNKKLVIVGDYYLRPKVKIDALGQGFNPLVTDNNIENKYKPHTSSIIAYQDLSERLIEPSISNNYHIISNPIAIKITANIIQENQVLSTTGFSSRMKSILDVFGDEVWDGSNDPPQKVIENYFDQSRDQLKDAGILINRTKKSTTDNEVDVRPVIISFENIDIEWPFGSRLVSPFENNLDSNSLPVVATNLSMTATPYFGCTTTKVGKYHSEATVFTTDNPDYRNLNSAIVDICKYATIQEYIDSIKNSYNILDENYSIIDNDNSWFAEENYVAKKFYKGDLFSQNTFMRCIRWNTFPENITNWERSWQCGIAFNMYLQSFTNSNLRVPSADDTFYPYVLKNALEANYDTIVQDFIWRNKTNQFFKESWEINGGYNETKGTYTLLPFDEIFTMKSNTAANRIYFSNVHVDGAFVDQYRQLPIGQYQDFNFEGGEIKKLVTINSTLFIIQRKNIIQLYGSTKLQSSQDSSEIVLGDKTVLSSQSKKIADFGTTHKESICSGDKGCYGVDWDNEKIWRIAGASTTSGNVLFGAEDLVTSKQVTDIFKFIKGIITKLPQDLYSEEQTGIISVFDEENKEILFTFKLGNGNYFTLVFNEKLDFFSGFYSYDTNFYMKLDSRLFSFSNGIDANRFTIWEHNKGDYQYFYNNTIPNNFELEFIINGSAEKQDVSSFEKEFRSHLMVMCPEEIENISWKTEYQESEKKAFINNAEFWTNPEYKEHAWNIPIIPSTNKNNFGPLSTQTFNTFEAKSQMRGQWIKVKIVYKGKRLLGNVDKSYIPKYFYLKNVITNFIISYS
jgi:hypothetical protein